MLCYYGVPSAQADAEEERKMEDDIRKAEEGDRAARKRVDAARLDSLQKKQVRGGRSMGFVRVFVSWFPHCFGQCERIMFHSELYFGGIVTSNCPSTFVSCLSVCV